MFDLLSSIIEAIGAPGVGLLMLLETLFPPIPSEVVMSMAGYNASLGRMSFLAIVIWGTLGAVVGSLFWYWVGHAIGADRLRAFTGRHGRWLGIGPEDITRTEEWFARYGTRAVLFCRLVPGIRTLISIPAGVARMPLLPYLAYTIVGTATATTLIAWAGWLLGSAYERIEVWLNPISNLVIVGLIAVYLYRVITWKSPEARAKAAAQATPRS